MQEEKKEDKTKEELLESLKNVSDLWLNDIIYAALKKLQFYEYNIRNGCGDLLEQLELQQTTLDLDLTKIENIKYMINEGEMLFSNVKIILTEERIKKIGLLIFVIRKIEKENWFIKNYDITHSPPILSKVTFHPSFYTLINSLFKLRSIFVEALKHILYIQQSEEKEKER